mgnify:CR=1 FL=1|jgi:Flp pilus assembly protein TadD
MRKFRNDAFKINSTEQECICAKSMALTMAEKFQEALQKLDHLISLYPNDTNALLLKGNILLDIEGFEKASAVSLLNFGITDLECCNKQPL